jgi:hypothetical protein
MNNKILTQKVGIFYKGVGGFKPATQRQIYYYMIIFITMELNEHIYRLKQLMGVITERMNDIQGTPLYHKTSTNRGLKIIKSDSLIGSLPSDDYLSLDKKLDNTKTKRSISFTRNKLWKPNHTIGIGMNNPIEDSDITFVVDQDRLKTRYKMEPFNYDGIDPNHSYTTKSDELEERVLTDRIFPLHKFILDIIYTGNNPKVQSIIDDYLSNK